MREINVLSAEAGNFLLLYLKNICHLITKIIMIFMSSAILESTIRNRSCFPTALRWQHLNYFSILHIYIYIYIYMCVCVQALLPVQMNRWEAVKLYGFNSI